MTYTELLKREEWHQKCSDILRRDKYVCKDCGRIGFHNGPLSYFKAETLEEINTLFSDWQIAGKGIADFCPSDENYRLDHIHHVALKRSEQSSQQEPYLLTCYLQDKNSYYFDDHGCKSNNSSVLSDILVDEVDVTATLPYNILKHANLKIESNWSKYVLFNKSLTKNIYS